MKKFNIITFSTIVILSFISGCDKSDTDRGCDCSTSSEVYYATHDNFLGYKYNGSLAYYTNSNNESAWYVGVNIPSTNYYGICKICNPNTPIVKAFTDTSSRKYLIPVEFSGALKKICTNESQNFDLYTLPETVFFYITIDSLKSN